MVQFLHPANFCSCPFNAILKIPAGKHLMDLVAVDWFKDSKRIDHVARRKGCAAQVRYITSSRDYYNQIFKCFPSHTILLPLDSS